MSDLARAKANGIKPATYYARIRRGMTPEQAATKPVRAYFYEWKPTCNN